VITATYRIKGGDFDGAGSATRILKGELARIGVEAAVMRRIMIAAYEAETNVVIHARKGSMWARVDDERLDLEIVDEGPGIPDIDLAMREGYSTASEEARSMGFGAGMGLPNIRKCSDLFEVESKNGFGTRVRSTIFLRGMTAGAIPAGSLGIGAARCRSCMDCIKACPTRSLRVRGGSPHVLDHLCIDCAACISVCPRGVFSVGKGGGSGTEGKADGRESGASVPVPGPGTIPEGSVLVIPRGFASGFPGNLSPASVIAALGSLGFTRVRFFEEWEQALALETVVLSESGTGRLPVLAPCCPAVVNLIETQFPSLLPHLASLASPVEAAAHDMALVPVTMAAACPAQHTEALFNKLTGRLSVVSLRALAGAVRPFLSGPGKKGSGHVTVSGNGTTGVSRILGGRAPAGFSHIDVGLTSPALLRVTGIRHVLSVLEQLEGGALEEVRALELFACDQGCDGSPLFARDPHLAARLWKDVPAVSERAAVFPRKRAFAARPGLRLDPDMKIAIDKLSQIDALSRSLPGKDCGSCGAPACTAFAEDVVLGRAAEADCPYKEERT
jgi:anti-sigma regulatory factor (Ser/Thr protein kinase)/NAD-dependent dihydropyrimidine dehydrogenase PreA subunit